MKISLILSLCIFSFIVGCKDNPVQDKQTEPPLPTGKLVLESSPGGASIFMLGTDLHKTTPYTIVNLADGDYEIMLKLENYYDTSFTAKVYDGLTTTKKISLHSKPDFGTLYSINEGILKFFVKFDHDVINSTIIIKQPSNTQESITEFAFRKDKFELIIDRAMIDKYYGYWEFAITGFEKGHYGGGFTRTHEINVER